MTTNHNPHLVQLSQDREKIGDDTHTFVRRVLQVPVQHGGYTVVHKEEREHHINTPAAGLSDVAIHDARVVAQELAIRYEGMIVHLEWLTSFKQDSDHNRAPTVEHTWRNNVTIDFAHLLTVGGGQPVAEIDTPSLASLFRPTMPPSEHISLSSPAGTLNEAHKVAFPAPHTLRHQRAELQMDDARPVSSPPSRSKPSLTTTTASSHHSYADVLADHASRHHQPGRATTSEHPGSNDSDDESVVEVPKPNKRSSVRADSVDNLVTRLTQHTTAGKGKGRRMTREEVAHARKQAKQAYNAAKKQLAEWDEGEVEDGE